MQTRDNGGKVPTNSDEYQLTQDLAAMADSLNVATVSPSALAMGELTKFEGRMCFRLDTAQLMVCVSGAWKAITPNAGSTPYAMAGGSWTPGVIPDGGSVTASPRIFPSGRFSVAPLITFGTGSGRLVPAYGAVTATSFVLSADNKSGGPSSFSSTVNWLAVQMTPTSAAG